MNRLYSGLVLLLSCMSVLHAGERKSGNSFEELKKEFEIVSSRYRSVPFWVWNYKVTKSEIDRMLSDFKEKGCGGVFVHPRYGMVTEYLSDEWFDLYSYTIEQGEKLGLDIWLYDENAYPSGFAGGLLPSRMPESYTQGHGLMPYKMTRLPEDYRSYFIILEERQGEFFDISDSASAYVGKKSNFILYRKTYAIDNTQPSRAWYAGFTFTDLLLPGVTDKFIEITMSGYEKNYRSKFGKSIKGIFSDEINIRSSGGIRWTPDLFGVFQQRYGYDLRLHLPSLHLQIGDWKRVRYEYAKLLSDLFIERWAKPWYEYCSKHDLIWTGHYWEQTWPRIEQVPDNMAMNAWQQMPGVDMLSNSFDEKSTSGMFGNVRVLKEAKSAANQMGRERFLCEAYGGGGWDMSLKDFKRHSDWLNVMGVNFMNQHLSHMSFVGVRKYDWPPMFCSIAPWWNDYKVLNEYTARMSAALTLGKQKNNILVLEPTTTTWMYAQHTGNEGNEMAQKIADSFQFFVTTLSKKQVEYDLGCEHIIESKGRVNDGKFIVGECAYETVVIPRSVENMSRTCFGLLQSFVRQGGKVITCSRPDRIEGIRSEKITNFFRDEPVIYFENQTDERLFALLDSPSIRFKKTEGGNFYHLRKEYEDGELLLVTNSSLSETSSFSIEMKGRSIVELDAFSGDMFLYPIEMKGGNVSFSGCLEPAGSRLFFISPEERKGLKTRKIFIGKGAELEASCKMKTKRLRDNALIIDYLDLKQNGTVRQAHYFMDANFDVFRAAGFKDGNPWFRAVQFKQDIVNKDVSGAPVFSTVYSFEITESLNDLSSCKLLCERAYLYDITVNGQPVDKVGASFLDKDFSLIPIASWLHTGINTIEMTAKKFSVDAEIEPIYILGDFSVVSKDNKWVIADECPVDYPASNQEIGAPFYPWEICYEKSYHLKEVKDSYLLSVPKWKGSVLQVWINGEKSGILFTEPYRLDVTDFMKQGDNVIELRVVGSMDNFFGPHHSRSKGSTPPWDWQKHNGNNDADGYILTDYGLLDDFDLLNIKCE